MLRSYFRSHISLLFLIFSPLLATPRKILESNFNSSTTVALESSSSGHSQDFERFIDAKRGSTVDGISRLKEYFHRFGYLPRSNSSNSNSFDDTFDAEFELAIVRYQKKLGLLVSGKLDRGTLGLIFAPRCGVPDQMAGKISRRTEHFVYFTGKPRWSRRNPMILTYAFSPDNLVHYLNLSDIRSTFERAFSRWASAAPIGFKETKEYGYADIRIGFYGGDHGDGQPFDGVLGILAHSFSPESGRLHLDSSERWAVDFQSEPSEVAVDLESVAMHEIGHVLGLAHSPVKEAIMYPSLKPRERKVDLKIDDVKGVQTLYGSKHNFRFGSLLVSETSSNEASRFMVNVPSKWRWAFSSSFATLIFPILGHTILLLA